MTRILAAVLVTLLSAGAGYAAPQSPSSPPSLDCTAAAGAPGCADCGGPDTDGDGVPRDCDLCIGFDDGADADGDGVPDGCDRCPGADDSVDVDADEIPDGCDLCVGGNDSLDADEDGLPDACDRCNGSPDSRDADGDSVPDGCDVCESGDDARDADADGVPDACDECEGHPDQIDGDGDGVADGCDACPGYDDRQRSQSDLIVCFNNGLVGVQTRKRTIGDVLDEMALQADFAMFLPVSVSERDVTVSFEPEPVEQAVRRVLQGTSFTARYSTPMGGEAARLAEIRVLAGEPTAMVSHPAAGRPGGGSSEGLLHAVRDADDPGVRAQAIAQLVQSDKGVETRRTVINALQDPAPEVRRAALDAAAELGSGAGTSAIARIARNDDDPDLRMQALRTLVAHDYPRGTAIAIIEIAARDQDARVAALARELKAELGSSRSR